jgi:hypothetical protein
MLSSRIGIFEIFLYQDIKTYTGDDDADVR